MRLPLSRVVVFVHHRGEQDGTTGGKTTHFKEVLGPDRALLMGRLSTGIDLDELVLFRKQEEKPSIPLVFGVISD